MKKLCKPDALLLQSIKNRRWTRLKYNKAIISIIFAKYTFVKKIIHIKKVLPVIVKRNGIAIIRVNAGGSNDRATEVSANIFPDGVAFAVFGFGIDIKTIFVI